MQRFVQLAETNHISLNEHRAPMLSHGQPNFPRLFKIKYTDRIPAMVQAAGREHVRSLVATMIMHYTNSLNLSNTLSAMQVVSIADKLLQMGMVDHVSIVELDVFLEQTKLGRYGQLYNRLDEAVLLYMFDQYLEQRWKAYQELKTEQQAQYKYTDGERAEKISSMQETAYWEQKTQGK